MKYDIKTLNGYDFFEVSSAMQKSIRRGLEDEALFWAVELFESNFAEYAWKRLRIISSEDIGLAKPNISSEIWALYCMHKEQAKNKDDKNKPERLFLVHAVLMLCRAKKSRVVDWLLIYNWFSHKLNLKKIPDFAFDKHNQRGRSLGRGWGHFFEEGTILNPIGDVEREAEAKELAKKAIENSTDGGLFQE
jgi:replication-associated recombination protein RarA